MDHISKVLNEIMEDIMPKKKRLPTLAEYEAKAEQLAEAKRKAVKPPK
tara:strand:- start:3254 stop:3397 length:144 start_codon:yes stop_codon:yes gene_type:complete